MSSEATITADPGVLVSAADDEEWMVRLVREERARKMPRRELATLLQLQGWVPVKATRHALQRDTKRVSIVRLPDKLTTSVYEHGAPLPRDERPWSSVPMKELRLMATRIMGEQL